MRSDIHAIPGPENPGLGFILKTQPCGADEHYYPFRFRLVVPEPRRARLTPRDDPLDAQARPGQHRVRSFGGLDIGKRPEEVHAPAHSSALWRCWLSTPRPRSSSTALAGPLARSPSRKLRGFHAQQPRPGERIRLGYLSADFRQHPVGVSIAGLIEHHDRRRFEVIGYSYGPNDGSALRTRLAGAFDRFVDISEMAHRQAAELIHADAIDILIDLTGYTDSRRTCILAYRPAPIQVNYLGYPGTMGADFIDYIIVDRFVVPPDQQPFFRRGWYTCPTATNAVTTSERSPRLTPSRAECGLPTQGFVFCCFNSSYKITPAFFDIWMRLLNAVPGSVLWLVAANALVKDQSCGVKQ